MIKAVVFDFFGVFTPDVARELADEATDPQVVAQIAEITRQNDLDELSDTELINQLAVVSHLDPAGLRQRIRPSIGMNQGVVAWVAELRSHFKVGLLSNAGPYTLDSFWPRLQLEAAFDVVVLSGDVGLVKPDPGIYHLMSERLALAPDELVFIDDVPRYVTAAQAAGWMGIVFTNIDQAKADLAVILGERAHA